MIINFYNVDTESAHIPNRLFVCMFMRWAGYVPYAHKHKHSCAMSWQYYLHDFRICLYTLSPLKRMQSNRPISISSTSLIRPRHEIAEKEKDATRATMKTLQRNGRQDWVCEKWDKNEDGDEQQTDPFKCGKGHVIILNVYNRVPSKVCMNN